MEDLEKLGIGCASLQAANCGWECDWTPEILAKAEGMPLKNLVVTAGATSIAGELLLTRYGLEGGTIYALGRELRAMETPALIVDFKPTFSLMQLEEKLANASGDLLQAAVRRWKLSAPAAAIFSRGSYASPAELAAEAKACRIELLRPRPIEEAISSADGVLWRELDENLMLKKCPGVFLAGEMIDWEAPTGGYLLQAAFATGSRAGRSAALF